jgi:hypothetical protein
MATKVSGDGRKPPTAATNLIGETPQPEMHQHMAAIGPGEHADPMPLQLEEVPV